MFFWGEGMWWSKISGLSCFSKLVIVCFKTMEKLGVEESL